MSHPQDLWTASPEALRQAMVNADLRRGWLATDPQSGTIQTSHAVLQSLHTAVTGDGRDYDNHRGMFFEIGRESEHLLTAFIHKTKRGQAAGGVRFWNYPSVEQLVRDGLRLSRGMGHKNALAGLWWGGGKGVIARRTDVDHRDPEVRGRIYRDYGRFISSLGGCYVTAEDAGTTPNDMAQIHTSTRHTTCIPADSGGSGNPSGLTARGVIAAMEAALEWLDLGDLQGKTIATQGLGNVACFMIEGLLERGAKRIVGTDIDAATVERVRRRFSNSNIEVSQVGIGDNSILAAECDVLAPNAIGAILEPETIPLVRASIVCGGANNQLADATRDAGALAGRGILYVPDFLANRMGIVNCANEQYGVLAQDPAILAHLDRNCPTGIHQRCWEVFQRAQASGRTPAQEAVVLADELADELHPIWGNRSELIIESLVSGGWC